MNNPFVPPISRKALLTFRSGHKERATAYIYPKPNYTQADYEREFVETFNRSQPNMPNKVIKCHLMRN